MPLKDSLRQKGRGIKLVRILTVVIIFLSATTCATPASYRKDDGTIQAGSELKQVVLEVSTIT